MSDPEQTDEGETASTDPEQQDGERTGEAGLSPRPTPTTETPELFPGGTDAVRDEADYADRGADPTSRDAHPDDNPAVEDATPDSIKQVDDKQQEPDDDERGEHGDTPEEPPA